MALLVRDACSDIYCAATPNCICSDKDDIVENNCNNINANACHYPSCNSTRLDFRQKLNRLQSPH